MTEPDYQIYAIQHEHGQVKLGRSTDPERRAGKIRGHTPYQIEIRTTLDGYDDIPTNEGISKSAEALLQRYYRQYRIKREWFDLPDRELAALEALDRIKASEMKQLGFDLFKNRQPPVATIVEAHRALWSLDGAEYHAHPTTPDVGGGRRE